MAHKKLAGDLALRRHNQMEALKSALEFKHSATNFLTKTLGTVAVKFRERAVRHSEHQVVTMPSRPQPKPLWEGPIDFHMTSAEATLRLPHESPLTSQEVVDLVVGPPPSEQKPI